MVPGFAVTRVEDTNGAGNSFWGGFLYKVSASEKQPAELTIKELEETYPHKFNKKTVYATISDHDSMGKAEPKEDSAIFTTYDSSKGLERKICVGFDFMEYKR